MHPRSALLSSLLLLASFTTSVSAYAYTGNVYGLGSPDDASLIAANTSPNATVSVPLTIGTQNFTMRVNVVEFAPSENITTTVTDPRIAASVYTLEWASADNATLNSTIYTAEGITGPDQKARFCVSVPLGVYSSSVTNGYSASDDGDCTGALGKQCVTDLKNMGYSASVPCGSITWPSSCANKMSDGGIASTSLISASQSNTTNNSTSANKTSPYDFSWYESDIYSASNSTLYKRELERLHVVVFSGTGNTPVCVRVKTDHVGSGDAATSAAAAGANVVGAGDRKGLVAVLVGMVGFALFLS